MLHQLAGVDPFAVGRLSVSLQAILWKVYINIAFEYSPAKKNEDGLAAHALSSDIHYLYEEHEIISSHRASDGGTEDKSLSISSLLKCLLLQPSLLPSPRRRPLSFLILS